METSTYEGWELTVKCLAIFPLTSSLRQSVDWRTVEYRFSVSDSWSASLLGLPTIPASNWRFSRPGTQIFPLYPQICSPSRSPDFVNSTCRTQSWLLTKWRIYKCIFLQIHLDIIILEQTWRFSNPGFELSLFFSCLITTHVARCNLNQQLRHAPKQIRQPVFIPSHEVDQVGEKVEPTLFWYCRKLRGYWTLVFCLMMVVLLKGLVMSVVLIMLLWSWRIVAKN